MGRLIRHARPAAPLPVRTMPVPMIKPAFRTLLVAVVSDTVLPPPGFRAASRAAIALPPIAVGTNPEHRLASLAAANPLLQRRGSPAAFQVTIQVFAGMF